MTGTQTMKSVLGRTRAVMRRAATVRAVLARLIAVASLLLATGGVGLVAAPMASAADCSTSTGVTVVVDYGSLGGTSVRCATDRRSGESALTSAGHTFTYVSPRQPMICTIDRLPDPCNNAPTTAYWSYWHASPGGDWVYSTTGAGSYQPKAGSVEGWAFGAGKPPSTQPPAAPRPKSTTSTSSGSRTTSGGSGSRTSSSSTSGGGRTASRTSSTTAATTGKTRSTASSMTGSPSASTAGGTGAAPSNDSGPRSSDPVTTLAGGSEPTSSTSGSGGTGTLVAAAALVLLLAGGAGAFAWRRRGSGA